MIEGADHHVYFDNPQDFVYKIVLDVFGEEKSNAYKTKKEIFQE